jgi:hypothetical protein
MVGLWELVRPVLVRPVLVRPVLAPPVLAPPVLPVPQVLGSVPVSSLWHNRQEAARQ